MYLFKRNGFVLLCVALAVTIGIFASIYLDRKNATEPIHYTLNIGDTIPNIQIYDIQNKPYKLYDLLNNKSILIYARIDCPDCNVNFDKYQNLIHSKNAIMLWSRDAEKVELESNGFDAHKCYFTHRKSILSNSVPTYFMLDKQGKILYMGNDINNINN